MHHALAHQIGMMDYQQIYAQMATTGNKLPHVKHVNSTSMPIMSIKFRNSRAFPSVPTPWPAANLGGSYQRTSKALHPFSTPTNYMGSSCPRCQINDNGHSTTVTNCPHPATIILQTATKIRVETAIIWSLLLNMDHHNKWTRTGNQWPKFLPKIILLTWQQVVAV